MAVGAVGAGRQVVMFILGKRRGIDELHDDGDDAEEIYEATNERCTKIKVIKN